MPRFLTRTLTAFAALGILAACSPETVKTPTPTPTHTPSPWPMPTRTTPQPSELPSEPSPEPTQTGSFPPPAADETEDQAAIREGWQNYWNVYDKFIRDPMLTDLSETQMVTTGEESGYILDQVQTWRQGIQAVPTGGFMFRDVTIGEPDTNADEVTIAVVSYCNNSSQLAPIYIDSGEPITQDLVATRTERATLERGRDDVWRVAMIRNEVAEC